MTRAQMRARMGRLVKDTGDVMYDAVEKNDLLNQGYALVQKEIRKVFPEAHLFWDYINTSINTSWYPLPETFGISQVGFKSTSSLTQYVPLTHKRYRDVNGLPIWSGGVIVSQTPNPNLRENFYTQRGQWIGIFPAPTEAVVSGIELIHCPIMSMSDDTDIPRIKTPLHMAIVWWASLLALGDTDTTGDFLRLRLSEAFNDLPLWYDQSSDAVDKLIVDA